MTVCAVMASRTDSEHHLRCRRRLHLHPPQRNACDFAARGLLRPLSLAEVLEQGLVLILLLL